MLGRNQRRRAVIKPASVGRLVFTGLYHPAAQILTLTLKSNWSIRLGEQRLCKTRHLVSVYVCCFGSSGEQTFPCNGSQHWELFPAAW